MADQERFRGADSPCSAARLRRYRVYVVLALLGLLACCHALFRFDSDGSLNSHGAFLDRLLHRDDVQYVSPYVKEKCTNIYGQSDQCTFVRQQCQDSEVGIIHYLSLYFCTPVSLRPVVLFIMLLWLLLLFCAIGLTASEFFCPNLATLSQTLHMSQSLAGVTLLALGNGSPDLFSTFAAMRVGSGSLAIGELIGAAFFITSAVSGLMAIINPFKVSRRPFLRDTIFFTGAVALSVALLAHGKLTLWTASSMIAYYIFYVAVVVFFAWYWRRWKAKRASKLWQRDEETTAMEENGTTAHEGTSLLRTAGAIDISAPNEREIEDGYARLQHRMMLLKPPFDELSESLPSHFHTSIRPSLLAALEFRSLSQKKALLGRHGRHQSLVQTATAPTHRVVRRSLTDPTDRCHLVSPEEPLPGNHNSNLRRVQFHFPSPEEERGPPAWTSSHDEADIDPMTPISPVIASSSDIGADLGAMPPLRLDTSGEHHPETEVRSSQSSSMASPAYDPADHNLGEGPESPCPYQWWPSSILPDPQFLLMTLFPTMRDFRSKPWLDKVVSIVAILPVLCLTITLPVVDGEIILNTTNDTPRRESIPRASSLPNSNPEVLLPLSSETDNTLALRAWNRWLTCIQCICAPLFITLIFFRDYESLVLPTLYALLTGLIALGLLLSISSPETPPNWQKMLCGVGFVVAVGWMSTIADEVIGILRAFVAILGVSEAILGVTIFAMGNSFCDFVADLTVAKMGFPIMAMSACFGGPMLNIMLGVGVSGLVINLTSEANYNISISRTLLVPTVSLFITLLSISIMVPLNGWRMTRTFGICLVVFFTVSTVASILFEMNEV